MRWLGLAWPFIMGDGRRIERIFYWDDLVWFDRTDLDWRRRNRMYISYAGYGLLLFWAKYTHFVFCSPQGEERGGFSMASLRD